MESLKEPIRELLKHLFNLTNLGWLESNINFFFSILSISIVLFSSIYKFIKWCLEKHTIIKFNKEAPYFTQKEVERAIKNFIQTKGQNISPSNVHEMSENVTHIVKEKLIPFFFNKVFNSKLEADSKYYIILSDSGMGKTTFSLNLYLRYMNKGKFLKLIGFGAHKYRIKLIPLGLPNSLNELEKISLAEQSDTILLLDAFDEDIEAVKNYKARMDSIIEITKNFKLIIITSRTQFFPSEFEEPKNTGIMKYGGEKGQHEFNKFYVSPFDDKDINKYIKMKYGLFKYKKRKLAFGIVKKSPNLMVRPMLLNYIDDLLISPFPKGYNKIINFTIIKATIFSITISKKFNELSLKFENSNKTINRTLTMYSKTDLIVQSEEHLPLLFKYLIPRQNDNFKYSYQIYEKLIEKWIERESRRASDHIKFKENLYEFSKQIAVNIYENRLERRGLFIGLEDISHFANLNSINLNQIEMTSRSLLNRNGDGDYKFAHRSILEYFLAKEALINDDFSEQFNYIGMDNVKNFIREIGVNDFIIDLYRKNLNFQINYLTLEGFKGTIYNPDEITINFIDNIYFIQFEFDELKSSDIKRLILTFTALRLFQKEKKGIEQFHLGYINLTNKIKMNESKNNSQSNIDKYFYINDLNSVIKEYDEFTNFENKLYDFLQK